MTWGFVAGAAISVVGGAIAGNKQAKSMDKATDAQYASIELQERMAREDRAMQKEQFDYFKQRQVGVDKTAEEVTRRELALAEETAAQGKDLYEYQKEVFRPVEEALVGQAMRESTPEYYERYVQQAMATQAQAQANAQGQTERIMASMGVNPNSGAYQSQQRGLALANAAQMGGVANESRDRAESLGWARRAEVAGLGKGLVGAGNASYGLATQSNGAAVAATNGANGQAMQGLGTPTQYGQLGNAGMNSVIQGRSDIYANTAKAYAATQAGIGQAAGAFGSLTAQYMNRQGIGVPRAGAENIQPGTWKG